mgnify:FL=1|jgi:drug/metabolite transporter (DMT)-like permease
MRFLKYHYHKLIVNDSGLGILLILIATLLLSVRSILVKLAYIENVQVMDLFYLRFLFTIPLLIAFAYFKKGSELFYKIKTPRIFIGCFLAGFFGYYLATLADFHSLKLINANINRIILYSFPVYVIIWNCLIVKRLPSLNEIITFTFVQSCLIFVLGGFNVDLKGINIKGVILALIAAISYSIYIILNQQIGKKLGSILFTTYAVTISFIFINIHYFGSDHIINISKISFKGYCIIITMAIFCTFLPLLLISESIKRIGSIRFAMINTLGPVMTIILCYIIINETMSFIQIFASMLIIIILFLTEQFKLNQNKN